MLSLPKTRIVALLALSLCGCRTTMWQASFHKPQEARALDRSAPFLKVHTVEGQVYVLRRWDVQDAARRVVGTGIHYSREREIIGKGDQEIPLARIALLETNRPESVRKNTGQIVVMAVATGASVALTAACIASPKTCFGSCPTFYASDGERMAMQAEGFSESVARSLETTDLDALFTARPSGRRLELRMTNEALETHAVRSVRVLVAPRPPGGRVLRAGSSFYPATALHPPVSCRAGAVDCLRRVRQADGREYLSRTDPGDLATREVVELSFERVAGARGLVIGARNSLVNTFLFYQILAYMGRSAGEWWMLLERGDPTAHGLLRRIKELLGDVEVSVLTRRGWVRAGAFSEVGPIAREVQLVPLPEDVTGEQIQVRLRLARGYWKLDYLALAELGDRVQPVTVSPRAVLQRGRPDRVALARLLDPGRYLITFPGSSYTLRFQLPQLAGDPELFLESRGYYYEWIREQWLAEEDASQVLRLIVDPAGFLRRMAPAYKKRERSIERAFWRSRVGARR